MCRRLAIVLRVRRPELLLVLALVAGGCNGVEVRGARITDAELQASGQWTKRDALARALLDLEAPGADLPVRLVPVRRKLVTEIVVGGVTIPVPRVDGITFGAGGLNFELGFLEALLGLDYEKRYHYVAALGRYVLLNRDRAATIASEDPDAPAEPAERTDPRAFKALREDLDRDVDMLLTIPLDEPSPTPAPVVEPDAVIDP